MKKFLFGVATASYQIEGTHNKFETIWDNNEDKILDNSNCDIACDFYTKYEEDIQYIKDLNVDVYRMSISWARIQPKEDIFSEDGIEFYTKVFEVLKSKNIKIDITLYHWDMPKWLYNKGVGFDNPKIVKYFLNYSKKMFKLFDKYARAWSTINEPWCISVLGYLHGNHAPFVKDFSRMIRAQYYTLMVHKEVYEYYKENYTKEIGIVFNLWKSYPKTNNSLDLIASEYSDIFHNQIYLQPLFKGSYPKKWLDRLEELDYNLSFIDQSKLRALKGASDYLGINYYSHHTVTYDNTSPFYYKHIKTGYNITAMGWEINPKGLIDVIKDVRNKHTNIPIYITENGAAFDDKLKKGNVADLDRTKYIKSHVSAIMEVADELNVRGYYVWSLLDNFEWAFGYTKRFGIIYVDFKTLKRYPKNSYFTYKNIIEKYKFNNQ